MASENVEDWDEPLPSSTSTQGEEEEVAAEIRRQNENLKKLECYVQRMAYRPTDPPCAKPYIENLAKPKKLKVIGNYQSHGYVQTPRERKERFKRMAAKYTAISTEQLEQIIKNQRSKEQKKEGLVKRKQELYYEMLTKLERQCRMQYLNVLLRKFANFIAKLATTMHIPPQLVEPYSRMQRGLFCNILLAIGVQPSNQAAIYYTSEEALEYEVCHKLAHALLSLVIKALDAAATKNPDDIKTFETEFEMDNYIKDRLMCAAAKKINYERRQRRCIPGTKPTCGGCNTIPPCGTEMAQVIETSAQLKSRLHDLTGKYKHCETFNPPIC